MKKRDNSLQLDKRRLRRTPSTPSRMDCAPAAPMYFFFFFQAEDGIRDLTVTGVQTCALPIFDRWRAEGRSVTSALSTPRPATFAPKPATAVASVDEILRHLDDDTLLVLDARDRKSVV